MKKDTSKQKDLDPEEHEVTPKWLKTIQLNSWEAELLISALVLYALFQIPDYLDQLALRQFDRGSQMHKLFGLLEKAFKLLSFGYILHILVRGIWVASVGLSYVFPNGVNTRNLKFKGNFRKELTGTKSLVKMVLKLEEASSIIYGVSFLFFGTFIGFGALILSFVAVTEAINSYASENYLVMMIWSIFIIFYFFLTLLVFIDFLTNGFFRRREWSADWFYVVAKIFRVLTLSFLYRRSLLVLISNTAGWKRYLIPFLILGVVGGYLYVNDQLGESQALRYYQNAAAKNYNPANYENTRSPEDHIVATIQSDIVKDNTLRLFMRDIGAFGGIYILEKNIFEGNASWDYLQRDSVNHFFNKRLKVELDGTPVQGLQWNKSQHPTTFRFGFTTFIRINSLEKGPHELTIGIDTTGMSKLAKKIVEQEEYSLQRMSHIYFIYD